MLLSQNIKYHKTRIAPTPSGFLHIGNILSFAITAALAKKTGAGILLRIDDLDRARANEGYIKDIFDTLNFLEIPWDEGPHSVEEFEDSFSQLNRIETYKQILEQLAAKKLVFACACSRTQTLLNACGCRNRHIPLIAPEVSWRLITDEIGDLKVKTHDGAIITAPLPPEMHSFIVRKKDGFPAYQLSSMVDDIFYGVDLIVRGRDLWPSTLAQLALASVLGKAKFQDIAFHHHALISDASGAKLSKSAGATSIKFLRESGKTAAEIYSHISAVCGVKEKCENWRQLGKSVIGNLPCCYAFILLSVLIILAR